MRTASACLLCLEHKVDKCYIVPSILNSVAGVVTSDGESLLSDTSPTSQFNSLGEAAASIASEATSAAKSLASEATSLGGKVATKVTCASFRSLSSHGVDRIIAIGGSVFTVITSAGGPAVTLASSGAGVVTSFAGSVYTVATSAAGSATSAVTGSGYATTAVHYREQS